MNEVSGRARALLESLVVSGALSVGIICEVETVHPKSAEVFDVVGERATLDHFRNLIEFSEFCEVVEVGVDDVDGELIEVHFRDGNDRRVSSTPPSKSTRGRETKNKKNDHSCCEFGEHLLFVCF